MHGMLLQFAWRELIWHKGIFSSAEMVCPTYSLTCFSWLLLLWNPPSSLSPFAPPLSQRRRLHLFCILTPLLLLLLLLLLWAASSLRQTVPFMKSVTWADLKCPGDAASRAPTAQVPWDIEGCLTFSSFSIALPCAFLFFPPLSGL